MMPTMDGDAWRPSVYRVARVVREFEEVVTLTLRPEGGNRPAFMPGQFNMLYAFGVGEAAISICGEDEGQRGFVHTIRRVGAVSHALASVSEGDAVGLRGPFGKGWPLSEAERGDIVFVAGGLGLAPLRPAIEQVLQHRSHYRRVTLLFGTRNPHTMLFESDFGRWRRGAEVDAVVTVDQADAAWRGSVGAVPALVPRATFDPKETMAMVCGPEVMMRFAVASLRDAGVPAESIHVSMERNMKCAIGLCGRCQYGQDFICRDGPVMRYDRVASRFSIREI